VRQALRDAVLDWVAAGRPSLPARTLEQMPAFMEQALAEEVPARYAEYLSPMTIIGRDGLSLHDFWSKDGARGPQGD
jgi:hypothetical protein